MRIGLYGMPTSGKTHILDRIDFFEVLVGSKLLRNTIRILTNSPNIFVSKTEKQ